MFIVWFGSIVTQATVTKMITTNSFKNVPLKFIELSFSVNESNPVAPSKKQHILYRYTENKKEFNTYM